MIAKQAEFGKRIFEKCKNQRGSRTEVSAYTEFREK
jgi:hypothetical protein